MSGSRAALTSLVLRNQADAFLVYGAARKGLVQILKSPLSPNEAQNIKAGDVYVWRAEDNAVKSWRDRHKWVECGLHKGLKMSYAVDEAGREKREPTALVRILHATRIATEDGGEETWRLATYVTRRWTEHKDPGGCNFPDQHPILSTITPFPSAVILADSAGPRKVRTRGRSPSVRRRSQSGRPERGRSTPLERTSKSPWRPKTRQQEATHPKVDKVRPSKPRSRSKVAEKECPADDGEIRWHAEEQTFRFLDLTPNPSYTVFSSQNFSYTPRSPPKQLSKSDGAMLKDGDLYVHQVRTDDLDPDTGEYIPALTVWVYFEKIKAWKYVRTDSGCMHPTGGFETVRMEIDDDTLKPVWRYRRGPMGRKYDQRMRDLAYTPTKRPLEEDSPHDDAAQPRGRSTRARSLSLGASDAISRRSRSRSFHDANEPVCPQSARATPAPPSPGTKLMEWFLLAAPVHPVIPIPAATAGPSNRQITGDNDTVYRPAKRRRLADDIDDVPHVLPPSLQAIVDKHSHERRHNVEPSLTSQQRRTPNRRSQSVGPTGYERRSKSAPLPVPPLSKSPDLVQKDRVSRVCGFLKRLF